MTVVPVRNAYHREKEQTKLRKVVKKAKDKVLSISMSLSMVHVQHIGPHYQGADLVTHFRKDTELEHVKRQI